jgi:hypothetical protein
MNKSFIKKYKSEFNYWLDGGNLLCRQIDSKLPPTRWYEFDGDWAWSIEELEIIINDEFVVFRKALADGKQLEFYDKHKWEYKKWDKLTWTNPNFAFSKTLQYRIKPEEPKLKVDD